jgi:hypothetical protein
MLPRSPSAVLPASRKAMRLRSVRGEFAGAMPLDLGDAGVGFEAEEFGSLLAGADAPVGPGEEECDAETDGSAGERAEGGAGDA